MTTPLRRASRNRTLDLSQYLIVGDESSIGQVELGIATLPLCARGRVFIEVNSAEQIVQLDAPPRLVVTWLVRHRNVPGEKAATAVNAWASEMLCDESLRVQAWLVGDESSTIRLRSILNEHRLSDSSMLSGDAFRY